MSVRAVPDACPGVLAPHDAADGALARIRLPGGVISAEALLAVADVADEHGDGRVYLTSRGNLQLRGLDRADPTAEQRLTAAGLVPSRNHERARNILASPLSGLGPVAQALDRALCARPALAELPGRFLFALDDGRGDVAAEEPDVCWQAPGRVLLAGSDAGVEVGPGDAVAALLQAAEAFLRHRTTEWRMRELAPEVRGAVARELQESHFHAAEWRESGFPATSRGHHAVVAPVLGELTAAEVRLVAGTTELAIVTPWRTVVLVEPGPVPEALPTEPDVARVSACAGRPGCAKALADVRADTRVALALGRLPDGRVHVAGCERRCGAPHGPHTSFVAGGEYL